MLFKGNSSRLELLIGKIQAHKESPSPPRDDKCRLKGKEALGTGSSSWHSEDGGPTSRKGGETPSSCATPTSASFPSEPEGEAENGANTEGGGGAGVAAPYPCQFCERTFPRLSYLKKHEQSHGDQMPYRCSWCARLFKHKRSRDRHVKLHTGDRRYRCSHCEAAFSRSDHLKIHMKTHDTQKPYQCTACSRGYNTAAALTSHMQSHKKHQSLAQGARPDAPDYGRRSVSSQSTASPPVPHSPSPSPSHNPNTRNLGKSPAAAAAAAASSGAINSPLKLACIYCTRDSFTSMQQLQAHVHTMHQAMLSGESQRRRVPSPGGSVSEASNVSRERPLESRRQASKERDARKRRATASVEPERLRTESVAKAGYFEDGFSCGQCTMKFSTLVSLRDHLVSIHRIPGFASAVMMCPLCGIPCSSAAVYAEHYVLQHCEDRRHGFPGEGVDRLAGFEDASARRPAARDADRGSAKNAAEYEAVESNDSASDKRVAPTDNCLAGTLLCGQCGDALKDFESFRQHLARHLQADQQKAATPRNPCPKCDVAFRTREDMLSHLTVHFLAQTTKEYACGACRKLYPHPDLLQRHLLDSHAHHLYRCALCKDTFDSRVAIQVHFAVKHSQECKIYHCNSCSGSNNENSPGNIPGEGRNSFRSEAEMANHVRSVHAPPPIESPALGSSPSSTPGIAPTAAAAAAAAAAATGWRCVFCGLGYSSDLELQLHLASHSTSLYRCPVCREGFAIEFLLDRHVQTTHQGGRSGARENGRIPTSRTQEDATRSLQKRGRSPASGNNNSLNQRDNNNKKPNYGQHCEICERGEFANDAELQAHKKLAHAPPKIQGKSLATLSLTCAYCGEICRSRSELESHTRMQHASGEPGGRHKCNICDEVCPSGVTLAEHKLRKHCKIQLSDTCVVCRGVLVTEGQFLEHMQRHSLESVDPQQRLDGGASLPHLPSPCVVCRQTLMSDLECRLHARHHLRASDSQSSQSSSPGSSLKSQSLGCCLCLREFSTGDFVSLSSSHATPRAGGQPLRVCKVCYLRHTQGLPILNSPYEHVRSIKSDRGWTASTDAANWRGTGDREWEREGKYKSEANDGGGARERCGEDCEAKFEPPEESERRGIVERDKSIGSDASNTYTCIQCQISFATEAKIRQHVKKEHLESSVKGSADALRCHLCLFEACSPLQLQGHLIEHTFAGCAALSCYICQALFTAPIGLQNHMLQQHGLGARPYDCSLCTLKFFFRAELDQHVATLHRNETARSASPGEDARREPSEGNRNPPGDHCPGGNVVVKEEEVQLGTEEGEEEEEEEEEDVNVEEHDEQQKGVPDDASATLQDERETRVGAAKKEVESDEEMQQDEATS